MSWDGIKLIRFSARLADTVKMKLFFLFLSTLISLSAFPVALQVCHLDSAIRNNERGFELFCNSPEVIILFKEANIDVDKNTLNAWNAMIQGFNSIYDPPSARSRRQRYFISRKNRGKAIQLMRTHGFESNNNVEFTRNEQLEIVSDNSERSFQAKKSDLDKSDDLASAREARRARVRPQ